MFCDYSCWNSITVLCKLCHLPVSDLQWSIFKKPTTVSTDWGTQTSLNRIYAQLQSHHLACMCGYMCVGLCMRVWYHGSHTCSPLSPSTRLEPQTKLLSVWTWTLFDSLHSSPQHCLCWNLNTLVCYGRKRLCKKYWEKKERPSQRVIWF